MFIGSVNYCITCTTLVSIIQKDGEIEKYVNHRIRAEWMKWRSALCDRRTVGFEINGNTSKIGVTLIDELMRERRLKMVWSCVEESD